MVFYFTGTGNSLYIAKQMEEEPISIPQVMGKSQLDFTAERIGIVTPIYGHEMPEMVKAFLRRAVFHTPYFFLLLTYGNRHGGAAELAQEFLAGCGKQADYINIIQMADNWLPSFDMDEQRKIDKHIPEQLTAIRADLTEQKHWIFPVTESDRAAHREFLSRTAQMPADAWQHLVVVHPEQCVGCGICEQVCPSGSIRVAGGKAVHTPGCCQTCLACVHACPHKAIGLAMPEVNPNARYRNEHITLQELIVSNHQA